MEKPKATGISADPENLQRGLGGGLLGLALGGAHAPSAGIGVDPYLHLKGLFVVVGGYKPFSPWLL